MRPAPSARVPAALLLSLLATACGGGGSDIAWPIVPAPAPAPAPSPAPAPTPAPAPSVRLDGGVDHPADLTETLLTAQPAIEQSVSFSSGSGPQTHDYTGTSLWSLLNEAGVQVDASRKNDVLSHYVIATGADGYRVAFSMGELSPDFGNRASIVAYATTVDGVAGPLPTNDGPFRVTAPGDGKGGRYVSNLTQLEVRSTPPIVTTTGGTPTAFAVLGAVAQAGVGFDYHALAGLPATTFTADNGDVYTGVTLWSLLNQIGLKPAGTGKNASLAMVVAATGADGYRTALSMGEIDPGFGNNGALVAYQLNGAPLDKSGMARLIVPQDVKKGRWVSNLQAIEVLDGTQ